MKDILIFLQAEVSAPANTEEANRPDYVLNKYDYFGYGKTSLYMILVLLWTVSIFIMYVHILLEKTNSLYFMYFFG